MVYEHNKFHLFAIRVFRRLNSDIDINCLEECLDAEITLSKDGDYDDTKLQHYDITRSLAQVLIDRIVVLLGREVQDIIKRR